MSTSQPWIPSWHRDDPIPQGIVSMVWAAPDPTVPPFPASLAQKVSALKPSSFQSHAKSWEALRQGWGRKRGSRKPVLIRAVIYFRLAAQAAPVFLQPVHLMDGAWQEWPGKLWRWQQPALRACLGDEPEGPEQPLSRGRETDYRKGKEIQETNCFYHKEWIYGSVWLSITLKLMLGRIRRRPFTILSFSHCISYCGGWALSYGTS